MEIKIYEALPPAVKQYFEEHGFDYAVGDMYIKEGQIARITKFSFDKKRKPVDRYAFRIYYQTATDWEATEWDRESSCYADEFGRYCGTVKLTKTVAEHHKEALDLMEGKIDISDFEDNSADEAINNESALIHRSSKESLLNLQKGLEERRARAELMKKFVGYEMEKRKQEMEVFREKLRGIVKSFEKKIAKIMRVITTIELYLGINEELFQIQDGDKAPSDTPISFRQMVLFMDEEIGHWKDGGLDYTNIEWFDNWLTVPENLQQVFPERKGVVVFRPRRFDKDYGEDAYRNAKMNAENRFRTYILIRNGDCLYRVYTENIIITDRLFPKRKELQELMEVIKEEIKEAEGWSNEDERKEKSKDKVDDMMYKYKKRAILLQGLIDRSEVFHPLPAEKINIFNMDELGDKVQFIYDDEAALPSGKISFKKWRTKINDQIKVGSRVMLTGDLGYKRSDYEDRWYRYTPSGNKVTYDLPGMGIFEVTSKWENRTQTIPHYYIDELEAKGLLIHKNPTLRESFCPGYETHSSNEFNSHGKKVHLKTFGGRNNHEYIEAYECTFKEEHLVIFYNPQGTVWTWDGDYHDRKNRVAFRIYPDDNFVLNYDQISLDDINFYLKSRVDRPNYLDMMPVLETVKTLLLKEKENEKEFIEFVYLRNYDLAVEPTLSEIQLRDRIKEAINWWKYKNQWKRGINKNDTLALRMIEKRILSPNYNKFEKY